MDRDIDPVAVWAAPDDTHEAVQLEPLDTGFRQHTRHHEEQQPSYLVNSFSGGTDMMRQSSYQTVDMESIHHHPLATNAVTLTTTAATTSTSRQSPFRHEDSEQNHDEVDIAAAAAAAEDDTRAFLSGRRLHDEIVDSDEVAENNDSDADNNEARQSASATLPTSRDDSSNYTRTSDDDESAKVSNRPRYHNIPTWARVMGFVFACSMGLGSHYSSHLLGPLKDVVKKDLSITNAKFSVMQASLNLVPTIMPFFGGLLVDRFGTGVTSQLALTMIVLGQTLAAVGAHGEHYGLMLAGMIVFGIGAGWIVVIEETVIVHFYQGKGLAMMIGIVIAIGKLLSLIGAGTALHIVQDTGSYQYVFYTAAGICFLTWSINIGYLYMLRYLSKLAEAQISALEELQHQREQQQQQDNSNETSYLGRPSIAGLMEGHASAARDNHDDGHTIPESIDSDSLLERSSSMDASSVAESDDPRRRYLSGARYSQRPSVPQPNIALSSVLPLSTSQPFHEQFADPPTNAKSLVNKVAEHDHQPVTVWTHMKKVLHFSDIIWWFFAVSFFYGAVWAPYIQVSSNIVKVQYHTAGIPAAWESVISLAMPMLANPAVGLLLDKVGRVGYMMLTAGFCLISAVILLMPAFSPATPIPSLLMFSLSLTFGPLSQITAIPLLLPTTHTDLGAALGVRRSLESIATILVDCLGGLLQDRETHISRMYRTTLWLFLGLAVVATLCTAILLWMDAVSLGGLLTSSVRRRGPLLVKHRSSYYAEVSRRLGRKVLALDAKAEAKIAHQMRQTSIVKPRKYFYAILSVLLLIGSWVAFSLVGSGALSQAPIPPAASILPSTSSPLIRPSVTATATVTVTTTATSISTSIAAITRH